MIIFKLVLIKISTLNYQLSIMVLVFIYQYTFKSSVYQILKRWKFILYLYFKAKMINQLSIMSIYLLFIITIQSLILVPQSGSAILDWKNTIVGYVTGQKVRYSSNIFVAVNKTKKAPGTSLQDGWKLFQEIYPKNAAKPAQFNIVGYLSIWGVNNQTLFNEFTFEGLTHVILSSLVFQSNSSATFNSSVLLKIQNIISKISVILKQKNIKLMLGIGGGNDCSMNGYLSKIGMKSNDSNKMLSNLTVNVLQLIKKYSLDGVDFDLQCWSQQTVITQTNLQDRLKKDGPNQAGLGLKMLLQNLRKNVSNTKILSAAVSSTPHYGNNLDPSMHQFVNWLGIMTYDFTGSWDRSPVGPHSALFKINNQSIYQEQQQGKWPGGSSFNPVLSTEQSLWYWSNPYYKNKQGGGCNIPRTKLMIGIPFYGYDFSYGKQTNLKTNKTAVGYLKVSYLDIVKNYSRQLQNLSMDGNIKIKGDINRPSFINQTGKYQYKHNIYFQSKKSAVQKLKFAKNVGCQGIIIWEILSDSLQNSILEELNQQNLIL